MTINVQLLIVMEDPKYCFFFTHTIHVPWGFTKNSTPFYLQINSTSPELLRVPVTLAQSVGLRFELVIVHTPTSESRSDSDSEVDGTDTLFMLLAPEPRQCRKAR
jgi:hypothetical protein